MVKYFKITGYIIIFITVIEFFTIATVNGFLAMLAAVLTIALGLSLIAVGNLINRVDFLEEHLNASFESANGNDINLPQKKCPKCGLLHDFDYPTCPNCKYKYFPDA